VNKTKIVKFNRNIPSVQVSMNFILIFLSYLIRLFLNFGFAKLLVGEH
jgi:hypothetical protein